MRWRKWGRLSWRLEFKPADAWVGIIFDKREGTMAVGYHAWLCVLPMVPLHLCLVRWKGAIVADPFDLAAPALLRAARAAMSATEVSNGKENQRD